MLLEAWREWLIYHFLNRFLICKSIKMFHFSSGTGWMIHPWKQNELMLPFFLSLIHPDCNCAFSLLGLLAKLQCLGVHKVSAWFLHKSSQGLNVNRLWLLFQHCCSLCYVTRRLKLKHSLAGQNKNKRLKHTGYGHYLRMWRTLYQSDTQCLLGSEFVEIMEI